MSTSHKHSVDKFAAALKRSASASDRGGAVSAPRNPKATLLPPITCVTCPNCGSRVHPRVRTFTKKTDGFDEVRGMCPSCGGVYWVYNREQERFNAPAGSPPRGSVRYVYKP